MKNKSDAKVLFTVTVLTIAFFGLSLFSSENIIFATFYAIIGSLLSLAFSLIHYSPKEREDREFSKIRIDRQSILYKLYSEVYDDDPKNICSYFWKLIFAPIRFSAVMIAFTGLISIVTIVAFFWDLVFSFVAWFFVGKKVTGSGFKRLYYSIKNGDVDEMFTLNFCDSPVQNFKRDIKKHTGKFLKIPAVLCVIVVMAIMFSLIVYNFYLNIQYYSSGITENWLKLLGVFLILIIIFIWKKMINVIIDFSSVTSGYLRSKKNKLCLLVEIYDSKEETEGKTS